MILFSASIMSPTTSFVFLAVIVDSLVHVQSKCPTLFEEFNKACYFYGNNWVLTPEAAQSTCRSLGGYLLNMNADLENSHTIDRLKVQTKLFDGYWIGGRFDGNLWLWERVDNKGDKVIEYMNPDESQYRNWGPGQPDAVVRLEYRPYVAIMVRHRPVPFAWYAEKRFNNMPGGMSYICEAAWSEDV